MFTYNHRKQYLQVTLLSSYILVFLSVSCFAQKPEKPQLIKLPFSFSDVGRTPMENTPFFFKDRLLIVANYRPGGLYAKGKDAYLYIDDLRTGQEVIRFGTGHSFVSAYVNGPELNVFALDFSDFGAVMNTNGIDRITTTDLKTWKTEKVISQDGDEHLFNCSVCKDDQGYLMAYESDKPVQFCFKFARSQNLAQWEKVPNLVFTGQNNEYSACPVIRYFKPYYYVIYLHAPLPGHNGWISFLARSQDIITWELSPFNPILEAGPGEGSNNSDTDLMEYEGKTYLYYATGDQATWGTLRVAMYDGPMNEFYEKHFPANTTMISIKTKKE